jgi:glucose-6-phosphate isomerase
MMVWEYAVAVAGRLLGINPFDQPDVESAKKAARGLLDAQPAPTAPEFTEGVVEVRTAGGLSIDGTTIAAAIDALVAALPADGYIAVQAYLDRVDHPEFAQLRDLLAAKSKRPVTFGWGPRFLHSTGQFHKGGPAVGVFLQLTHVATEAEDLAIPDRPFTFGQLIRAQAAGDAGVLAEHGRPVLTLTLSDVAGGFDAVRQAIG